MSKPLLFVVPLLLSIFHPAGNAQTSADQQHGISATTGSVWLLMRDGYLATPAFEKIEMESIEQCEMQGALYVSSERLYRSNERRGFECIEGK